MSTLAWDHRLARRLARPVAKAGIHPNLVTTFGLVLGLGAGVLFALGTRAAADWGAALFVIAAFADHVDGEVARLSGKTSTFGHYYDHIAALASYSAMFVGAGLGFRDGPHGAWTVGLGLVAAFAVAAIMYVRFKIGLERGNDAIRQGNFLGFEPEDTLYAVAPLAWLDGLQPFIVAAGVGAPLFLVWVLLQARRGPEPVIGHKPGP